MDKNPYSALEKGPATDTKMMPGLDTSTLWGDRVALKETSKEELNRLGLPDLRFAQAEEPARANADDMKPKDSAVSTMPPAKPADTATFAHDRMTTPPEVRSLTADSTKRIDVALSEKPKDASPYADVSAARLYEKPSSTTIAEGAVARRADIAGSPSSNMYADVSAARVYEKPAITTIAEGAVAQRIDIPSSRNSNMVTGRNDVSAGLGADVQVTAKPLTVRMDDYLAAPEKAVTAYRNEVMMPTRQPSLETWQDMENHDLRSTDNYIAGRQRVGRLGDQRFAHYQQYYAAGEKPSSSEIDERATKPAYEMNNAPFMRDGAATPQFDKPASKRGAGADLVPERVKPAPALEERRYEREYERPGSGYSNDELPLEKPRSVPSTNAPEWLGYNPEPSAMLAAGFQDVNSLVSAQLRQRFSPQNVMYNGDSFSQEAHCGLKVLEQNPEDVINNVDSLLRDVDSSLRVREQDPQLVIDNLNAVLRKMAGALRVQDQNAQQANDHGGAPLRNLDCRPVACEQSPQQVISHVDWLQRGVDADLAQSDRIVLRDRQTRQAGLADGAPPLPSYGYYREVTQRDPVCDP